MKIEEQLCRAFCDGIIVEAVPAGLAIATAFEDASGDRIAFYVVRDSSSGLWRIEDDGILVPLLVATGSDVTQGQRQKLFDSILMRGGVEYDEESGELRTPLIEERDIPAAALRFAATLMRVASLTTMRAENVVSTFREDAIKRVKSELAAYVPIFENEPINDQLSEFTPDLVLRPHDGAPVALFVAVSDNRLYEAIFLRMSADHEFHQPCSVVALLDREGSNLVSKRIRQRAQNRLDAVPVFYGEESAAVARLGREANVRPSPLH